MATERVRKLLELAEQLDPKERAELADELLHSVAANDEDESDVDTESALHPDWERELQQRMDDVEQGRAELVSWTDAKASLQKVIASSRRRE